MATRPDISPDARVNFDHHSDEYNLHELAIDADLRRKCPVAWNDNYGGFWFLSSYDAVTQAARDGDTFAHKYEPNAADGVDYQGEMGVLITSLVASLEDGLASAIAGVPAVDLVDLIGRHARKRPTTTPPGRDTCGSASAESSRRSRSPRGSRTRGALRLRRGRRPAGAPAPPGAPPVGALGPARDRLVRRRSHRVHALAAGAAIHRRRPGAVWAYRSPMTARYLRWIAASAAKPLVNAYRRTGAGVALRRPGAVARVRNGSVYGVSPIPPRVAWSSRYAA